MKVRLLLVLLWLLFLPGTSLCSQSIAVALAEKALECNISLLEDERETGQFLCKHGCRDLAPRCGQNKLLHICVKNKTPLLVHIPRYLALNEGIDPSIEDIAVGHGWKAALCVTLFALTGGMILDGEHRLKSLTGMTCLEDGKAVQVICSGKFYEIPAWHEFNRIIIFPEVFDLNLDCIRQDLEKRIVVDASRARL
ncbi:MAG: hypothetical protein H6679_05845 [Epsilonproteobacteria bacterium]|nr:hypothetical protein [Campylobacterota bacterium]